ncbi:MAG: Uncharacterised protein [Prochlorococcus marinus str. MIT 9215]|nr:MAG: Uncharacterised protein [Prochlorococcus marinus str. MIT 9215]
MLGVDLNRSLQSTIADFADQIAALDHAVPSRAWPWNLLSTDFLVLSRRRLRNSTSRSSGLVQDAAGLQMGWLHPNCLAGHGNRLD